MNLTDEHRDCCCDACATLILSDNDQTLGDDVETLDDNGNDNGRRREDATCGLVPTNDYRDGNADEEA